MPTDRVFLTGASGFVGGHILRELRASGYPVRALVRAPGAIAPDASTQIAVGDLRAPGEFARALEGCRWLIHCAALYSFSPRDRRAIHAVNVVGTHGLLEAARLAGIERVVFTSSSAALGAARDGRARTESDWAPEGPAAGYHHSKLEQERAAFASRVPVISLLPTAPVGPGDAKPTPTGKMVLDFARGAMRSLPPPGGLNLVPVEDVARAHVRALTQGRTGERYILGGENLTLDEVWSMLSDVTGVPMPRLRAPYALALAAGYADELRCRLRPGVEPAVPLEGVKMSRDRMFADSSKARAELDFHPGPVRDALSRAVAYYRETGMLDAPRRA